MSSDSRYIPPPVHVIERIHSSPENSEDVGGDPGNCERLLQEVLGSDRPLELVDSGTSGLVMALRAASVGAGAEVILSSFNCPQVIDAVAYVGATPVLADVDELTGVATLRDVEPLVTGRTRALILTHQFGVLRPASVDLAEWAQAIGLYVIDDAAQALGCTLGAEQAGLLGDVGVFSFGSSKPISAGGGGAVVWSGRHLGVRGQQLPQRETAASTRQKETFSDVKAALDAKPVQVLEPAAIAGGTRSRLSGVLSQLPGLITRREHNLRVLSDSLAGTPVSLMSAGEGSNHAFAWLRVDAQDRYKLGSHLSAAGYECGWYHYPLHNLQRYTTFGLDRTFPATERLWPAILQIPMRYASVRHISHLGGLIRGYFDV